MSPKHRDVTHAEDIFSFDNDFFNVSEGAPDTGARSFERPCQSEQLDAMSAWCMFSLVLEVTHVKCGRVFPKIPQRSGEVLQKAFSCHYIGLQNKERKRILNRSQVGLRPLARNYGEQRTMAWLLIVGIVRLVVHADRVH